MATLTIRLNFNLNLQKVDLLLITAKQLLFYRKKQTSGLSRYGQKYQKFCRLRLLLFDWCYVVHIIFTHMTKDCLRCAVDNDR